MQNVSVRLDAETLEEVEEEAEELDMTRAAYIRDIIQDRHEIDEARSEIERLQTDLERIQRTNQQILEQREENQQLRKYVEDEKTWHEAALLTRLKWYIYGKE